MKSTNNLVHVTSVSTISNTSNSSNRTAKSFTKEQSAIYSKLLIGLKFYTKEELNAMNSYVKKSIQNHYYAAQKQLNLFKQKTMIKQSNDLFETLFPNSNLTNDLKENSDTSNRFLSTLSFKDLGISKSDIATMFVEKGLLPDNFWEL